jgi:DNA repair protein RadD
VDNSPTNSPPKLLITRALGWDGIAYDGEEPTTAAGRASEAGSEGLSPGARILESFLDALPSACDVLRTYQREQLAQLASALHADLRRVLIQLATGGGKTHQIAAIALAASLAGFRVLILATRTRLVRQIHERLDAFGASHGVIAAPLPELMHHGRLVQVASVDTLYRRALVNQRMPLPSADIVVFDEAHLSAAESRKAILDSFPGALRIGFTATPARKSGLSLGAVFEHLITGPSPQELIAADQLVRPRIFNTPVVSESELAKLPKDAANDYQSGALGALFSRPKLIGDVVENWNRIAAGKRTIIFACSKAHGAELTREFCRAGIAAELVTDADGEDIREQVFQRLESAQTLVVVNVFLAAYGIDIPSVECIVLARPTRSLVMYLQMVGRGMRPAPGKSDFLVVDHGRVVENLGLPHAPRDWTLDASRNVNTEAREQYSRKTTLEKPRTCPECQHLWLVSEEGDACRECGWRPLPKPKAVAVQAATLTELEYEGEKLINPHSPEVLQFFREAISWYGARWPDRWRDRQKSGRWWAWSQTRAKFGFAETVAIPRAFWEAHPDLPTSKTRGWLKAQQVRFAKRRRVA